VSVLFLSKIFGKTYFTEQIEAILKDKHFKYTIDLGCGVGRWGSIIRPHTEYLVGVDIDPKRLRLAKETGYYDEVIEQDIRYYSIPLDADSVIMIEVIEHLTRDEGFDLLDKLYLVPFVLITTPIAFHQPIMPNHHQSLWTREDFEAYGFKTFIVSQGIIDIWFLGNLVAYRDFLRK
jgi:SAM-dependent methyltransferase